MKDLSFSSPWEGGQTTVHVQTIFGSWLTWLEDTFHEDATFCPNILPRSPNFHSFARATLSGSLRPAAIKNSAAVSFQQAAAGEIVGRKGMGEEVSGRMGEEEVVFPFLICEGTRR